MKKLNMTFLAVGICFASNFVNAQAISGKITGKIVDENRRPVDGATVSLSRITDSVTVKYELTATDGSFKIERINKGIYRIFISSFGMLYYKSDVVKVDGQHLLIQLSEITCRDKQVIKAKAIQVELFPGGRYF